MHPLVVENVSKRYGATLAVDDVSFEVRPGRILGLLGPNGAGKTSALRMIAYITAPDTGSIRFGDLPVGRETQRLMGYLPEERGLYRKMKVGDQLVYLGRLKGLSTSDARAAAKRWLDRLGGGAWFDRKVEELSKGMQQKIQFIATVLHDPKLCIFDEPFSGLDPINAALLKNILDELIDDGRTILFASHRMEQVEQLCDDIFLIANGREVLHGGLREIKRSFGQNTVLVRFDGEDGFLNDLAAEGIVRTLSRTSDGAELRLLDGAAPRTVLERALASGVELSRFEVTEPPLSEIFVMAVQGEHDPKSVMHDS